MSFGFVSEMSFGFVSRSLISNFKFSYQSDLIVPTRFCFFWGLTPYPPAL